jgi:Helitron helicase-like domain at N-terminus
MIYKDNYDPNISYEDRVKALQENPVLACRAFKARIQNIVKYIWQGKSEPLGEVIDFWIRLELQSRGSFHVHIILWVLLYYLGSKLSGKQLTSLVSGNVDFINDKEGNISYELKQVITEISASTPEEEVKEDSDYERYENIIVNTCEDSNAALQCQLCGTDAPDIATENEKKRNKRIVMLCRQLVSDIVSKYIKAMVPPSDDGDNVNNVPIPRDSLMHGSLLEEYIFDPDDINEEESQELRKILLSVQMHDVNHRKTCFKKGCFCRFYFPRKLRDETTMKFVKLKGLLKTATILSKYF